MQEWLTQASLMEPRYRGFQPSRRIKSAAVPPVAASA